MTTTRTRPAPPPTRQHVESLSAKTLPHAIESECAMLGAMILEGAVIDETTEIAGEDDFYLPKHRAIYRAIAGLWDSGTAIDMVQLTQRLRDAGELENVGGVNYLLMLCESVPSAAAATRYARDVREQSDRRKLIDALGVGLQKCYETPATTAEVRDEIETAVMLLSDRETSSPSATAAELMQAKYDQLQSDDVVAPGIATGWLELDDILRGGFHAGEMIVIAARPSVGKSAFMLQAAMSMANGGTPAVLYSLEMSREQIGERLLSMASGVGSHRLRKNMLHVEEWGRINEAVSRLGGANLHIDDSAALSVATVRSRARRKAARDGVKIVFVDYMQLMVGVKSDSREQEVASISRGLKALARELSIPVVVLSQLNRRADETPGSRPRLSQLRESGAIEQDADVVILLHRRDYQASDKDASGATVEVDHTAEVIVAKQRNGPTGTVELVWNGSAARFELKARGW